MTHVLLTIVLMIALVIPAWADFRSDLKAFQSGDLVAAEFAASDGSAGKESLSWLTISPKAKTNPKVAVEMKAVAKAEKSLGPGDPRVAHPIRRLGLALHQSGDFAGAKTAYERSLAINEKNRGRDHFTVTSDLSLLAGVLQGMGDHAGAKAAYERQIIIKKKALGAKSIASSEIGIATSLIELGAMLRVLGEHMGAERAFKRALNIADKVYGLNSPMTLKQIKRIASKFQKLGDHAGAKAAFEWERAVAEKFSASVRSKASLGDRETTAIILTVRAMSYLLRSKYDLAIKSADKAIRLDPDYVGAFAIRAKANSAMGQYDRAIKDAANVLRLDPDYAEAFAIRAGAYYGKHLYDRAIADADSALRLKPDMDLARRNKALALNSKAWNLATARDEKERNGQQAVRLAEQAKRLNSDEPYIHGTLAAAYAESGRFADALASQERAIAMLQDAGNREAAADFQTRLDLYRQNKPYRQ